MAMAIKNKEAAAPALMPLVPYENVEKAARYTKNEAKTSFGKSLKKA